MNVCNAFFHLSAHTHVKTRQSGKSMNNLRPFSLLLFVGAFTLQTAQGATLYWDLNGATGGVGSATPSGTWDLTTGNWSTDSAGTVATGLWTDSNTAIFSAGNDASGAFTVTLSGTRTVTGITIEEGDITFATGVVSLGGNNITLNSGTRLSVDSTLRITATSGASLTLNGATIRETNPGSAGTFINSLIGIVVGASGGTVDYSSSGTGTSSIYSGSITGTGILTKTGAGEFRFQGADASSTYTKLVVNQGLFRLGNGAANDERGFGAVPGSFTADAITLNGGSIGLSFGTTLNANRGITIGASGGSFNMLSAPMTVSGAIAGGVLTVTGGSQALTLNGVNSFTGGFTMNGGGNVTVGASGRLSGAGAVTITSGTLTLNNAATTVTSLSGAGNLAFANNHVLTVGDSTPATTFTGVISGSGSIVKTGSGTLILGGASANTFTGPNTINQGILQFNKANGFGSGNDLTLGPGTLNVNGLNQTFGILNLAANCTLDFGSGASTTTFANSSGSVWGSSTLQISGWTAGSDTLKFGIDSTGLTQAQLNQMDFVDLPGSPTAQIDANGIVTPVVVPEPSVLACLGFGVGALLILRRRK